MKWLNVIIFATVFVSSTLFAEVIVLQNGLNGYDGCIDSWATRYHRFYKKAPNNIVENYASLPADAGEDEKLEIKLEHCHN